MRGEAGVHGNRCNLLVNGVGNPGLGQKEPSLVKRKLLLGGRHLSSRSECPSDQVDGASEGCGRVFCADLGGVVSFSLRGPEDRRLREGSGKRRSSSSDKFRDLGNMVSSPQACERTMDTGGSDSAWYQGLSDTVLLACGLLGRLSHHLPFPTREHRITAARFLHKRKRCTSASAMQEIEPSRDEKGTRAQVIEAQRLEQFADGHSPKQETWQSTMTASVLLSEKLPRPQFADPSPGQDS
ncbi:hypothetical protein N431DRAFT_447011 [Stipitochalara longipes BDJ]|nr:hypothetical protein N431DRAFT_447011 [Stipitochalara longipes BDJ]